MTKKFLNIFVVNDMCIFLNLEHVASGVLLPLDVVVNTFLQVISALNHVHSKGIVHFDVKLEVYCYDTKISQSQWF